MHVLVATPLTQVKRCTLYLEIGLWTSEWPFCDSTTDLRLPNLAFYSYIILNIVFCKLISGSVLFLFTIVLILNNVLVLWKVTNVGVVFSYK